MKKNLFRMERINGLVLREVTKIILQEVKDPRVKMVSINSVIVSRDFRHASLYVTSLDSNNTKEIVKVLNKAQKFIRTRLAEKIALRYTPILNFKLDEHLIHTNRIMSLIAKARQADLKNNNNQDQVDLEYNNKQEAVDLEDNNKQEAVDLEDNNNQEAVDLEDNNNQEQADVKNNNNQEEKES